jgi:hypothetical protein
MTGDYGWPPGWQIDQPFKCKRCGSVDAQDHPEQELCVECDNTRGYKLCDNGNCMNLFVPSKSQRYKVSKMWMPKWVCAECSGDITSERWRIVGYMEK